MSKVQTLLTNSYMNKMGMGVLPGMRDADIHSFY